MIKLFYHKEFYNGWSSELVLLYDDLKKTINDNRFIGIINDSFTYVNDIKNCDYVILPYKWRGLDNITKTIIEDCKKNNKKILVFYNDDDDRPIPIDEEDGYIFRTSFNMSSKKENEYSLPPFFTDNFSGDYINYDNLELSVGFCGFDHFYRKIALEKINMNNKIKTDFIIRKSFWAREISEEVAILEFDNNIKNNLFGFTSRGAGNFSYRFYQILSMGRIPILLNTDCVLPFINYIDYEQHSLVIDINDLENIQDIIINFFNSKSKKELHEMQINNRRMYLEYLSPNGFIKNISKLLK